MPTNRRPRATWSGVSAGGRPKRTPHCTEWTECIPIVVREAEMVVRALGRARELFPFPLRGVDFDNDSLFMNDPHQTRNPFGPAAMCRVNRSETRPQSHLSPNPLRNLLHLRSRPNTCPHDGELAIQNSSRYSG